MSIGEAPRSEPWYAEGLRFECTRCGACCRGEGYVWVDDREVRALASFLDLDVDTFGRRYLRRVGRRLALVDGADGSCVFWKDGCSIYPVRPTQCRTFPFWTENLPSKEDWEEASDACPGMDTGRLYEQHEIEKLARGEGEAGAVEPSRCYFPVGEAATFEKCYGEVGILC